MTTFILILLFTILAVLSFFFAVSETAVIALSKIRLRHMVSKGIKRAQSIQNLVTKLDKFIAAILVGNDFVNIAMSAIVTVLFVPLFGSGLGATIATFTTTLFVLIVCDITPKMLAAKHTEKSALITAPLMEAFIKAFNPVIIFFVSISNFILRIFKIGPTKRSPLITEEELRLMIEVGKDEGVLSDEERQMFHRIFEFGDTRVSDVMVPKDKMVAVNLNTTPEELLNIFVEEGHARLPVYSGDRDNVLGIIYARDLLYILRDKGLFLLQDLVHKAYYVLENMRVNELLRKFQTDKIQIAIVVDSNQKTLGLVTLEDLTEEIVGEIEEKHTSAGFHK
ncbi:MAG: hemolysin family protein [Candidatus Omnitrophica bacterium]|jgi:CBS domain containing-hemolysin-like protein|nr:hemolysin family protein [Candidatus Omnitrophota bacterium]